MPYRFNSLLPITILAPTYSILCNLSLVWVFKIIFPFIFSLTPVCLYELYREYRSSWDWFDSEVSFLSAIVFIFFYGFFKDLPDKQHIAEFFMTLILMLSVKDNAKPLRNKLLAFFLAFSLATSHYGVSYLFMLSIFFAILFSFLIKKGEKMLLTSSFVLPYTVITLGWYKLTSSGYMFNEITRLGTGIIKKITSLRILEPSGRSGVTYALYETPSFLWETYKIIYSILIFLIMIGILWSLISIFRKRIHVTEPLLISFPFFFFLILQITTTYGMGFDRVLQITLTLLSPFALIGSVIIINCMKIRASIPHVKEIFSVFMCILLLFSSGIIFEMCGDKVPPYAIALNKSTWDKWNVFTEREIQCVKWIRNHSATNKIASMPEQISRDGLILSTYYRGQYYHGEKDFVHFDANTKFLPSNIPIYLGYNTKKFGKIPAKSEKGIKHMDFYTSPLYIFLRKSDKIYDNGCNIYIS